MCYEVSLSAITCSAHGVMGSLSLMFPSLNKLNKKGLKSSAPVL